LHDLYDFAYGLLWGKAAIRADLTLVLSQGQAEGQMNRVNNAKEANFGRAKLDLLRQRVLLA